MNLIKVSTQFYPYTINELKRDYPFVSFPQDLFGVNLANYDAAVVITDPQPAYDEDTQKIVPIFPVLINGEYRVQWQIVPLTVQEIKARTPVNWDGFNAAILADPDFNGYYGAAIAAAPWAVSSIPAALTQVSTNGIGSFATVYNIFCQAASVTQPHREGWAVLAENNNLPQNFIDLIRGI